MLRSESDCGPSASIPVVINVGGIRFETLPSTLQALPELKLAHLRPEHPSYNREKHEYFFDRDPDIFKCVLNFCRTGELHVPHNICGPLIKKEFDFWGVCENGIQQCCWTTYHSYNVQREALDKFEVDFTPLNWCKMAENLSSPWRRLQFKCWGALENPFSSKIGMIVSVISMLFVALSVFLFCAETHKYFREPLTSKNWAEFYGISVNKFEKHHLEKNNSGTSYSKHPQMTAPIESFFYMELMCSAFFTLDLFTRLVICPQKCKFFRSILNIVDVLALTPFCVELIVHEIHPMQKYEQNVLDAVQVMRIFRVFRLFRLIQHYTGTQILVYTLKGSLKGLVLLSTCLAIAVIIFASLIHHADNKAIFTDIPIGFWWALITMTTVGYGDYNPTTPWGYVVGGLTAVSGLLLLAFTIPILVNNFMMYYKFATSRKRTCQQPFADFGKKLTALWANKVKHNCESYTSDTPKGVNKESIGS